MTSTVQTGTVQTDTVQHSDRAPAGSRTRRTLTAVAAASVLSIPACIAVAMIAVAAGTPSNFSPIASPYLLVIVDVVLGIAAGAAGWNIVGRRSPDPARTLTRLVPTVLLASFVPDLLIGVAQVFPHTTVSGVVTLMTMHVVVAAIAVTAYLRLLSPWRR